MVENKKSYDFSLLDDVAIGKLLIKNLEVPVTEGYYQDFLHGYPLFKDNWIGSKKLVIGSLFVNKK